MRRGPVARAMRLPAALLLSVVAVAALSGCAMPGEDAAEDEDPLFGLCPQWTQGPGEQAESFVLPGPAGNASGAPRHEVAVSPNATEHQGQPLDMVRVTLDRLEVDGRLSLRAFDGEGDQLPVRDYRQEAPQLVPVVVMTGADADGAGGLEFDVFLSAISHDAPQAPGPVTLRWSLDGAAADVAFTATFHYKVCGL